KQSTEFTGLALTALDIDLGRWIGEKVNEFIQDNSLNIDIIASHGHTVFHQTEKGITRQIGDGNVIAAVTGKTTIYDFRSFDVALGGQGAPLVPIGDRLLFHEFDYCLNLGGIANISFESDGQRFAFDICPCNMTLNHLAKRIHQDFDKDGEIAQKGITITSLLKKLDDLDFYTHSYPKSLGYEWVRDNIFPLIEEGVDSTENLMRTLADHTVNQITKAIIPLNGTGKKLLVTGGGAFNLYIIEQVRNKLSPEVEVYIPEKDLINYKEAIVFGFLGVLRARSEINCLSSVTGAQYDNSGGVIAGPFTV
ncbi:MAG: anhydro-N-acetylmuramic acid kinase, partial [Fulvivirga sp.]